MTTDLKACPFCGNAERLYVQLKLGTILSPAYRVYCDNCGSSSAWDDRGKHVAAWNTRAEGDAGTQREGALRMYVVAFCALIEGLADAADIDLTETEMTMESNGKQLAAKSVEQMIADAKKLAGIGANHDN